MSSLHHVQTSLDVQISEEEKRGTTNFINVMTGAGVVPGEIEMLLQRQETVLWRLLRGAGSAGGQRAPALPVASSGADGARWGSRARPGPGLVLGRLGTTQFSYGIWKVNTPLCLHKPENRKNIKTGNYSHWNLFTWADSSVWSFYLYTQDDFAEEFAFIGLDFIPTSFAGSSSNEYLRFLENRLVGLRTAHRNLTLGEISLELRDHSFLLFLYTLD